MSEGAKVANDEYVTGLVARDILGGLSRNQLWRVLQKNKVRVQIIKGLRKKYNVEDIQRIKAQAESKP